MTRNAIDFTDIELEALAWVLAHAGCFQQDLLAGLLKASTRDTETMINAVMSLKKKVAAGDRSKEKFAPITVTYAEFCRMCGKGNDNERGNFCHACVIYDTYMTEQNPIPPDGDM